MLGQLAQISKYWVGIYHRLAVCPCATWFGQTPQSSGSSHQGKPAGRPYNTIRPVAPSTDRSWRGGARRASPCARFSVCATFYTRFGDKVFLGLSHARGMGWGSGTLPADEEPRTLDKVVANHDMVAARPAFLYPLRLPGRNTGFGETRGDGMNSSPGF